MLSRYVVSPSREGHLQQLFHIFAYLKHQHKLSKMVFDDTDPVFDESCFKVCDWLEFYLDAEEAIPHNVPEEWGHGILTSCFVDSDHAGCKATQWLHTGVILFINKAPGMWCSKHQNTMVETTTFGLEFCTLKTAMDMIKGLRYKLWMMGIPVNGPTSVFCNNESVVKNLMAPESMLKKHLNAITYHQEREAQAAGIIRVAWESRDTQIGNLLTKLMPGPRLKDLIGHVLW
jgi:hypothetical protein